MIKFTIHLVRNNLLLMMLIVKQLLIRFEPIRFAGFAFKVGGKESHVTKFKNAFFFFNSGRFFF